MRVKLDFENGTTLAQAVHPEPADKVDLILWQAMKEARSLSGERVKVDAMLGNYREAGVEDQPSWRSHFSSMHFTVLVKDESREYGPKWVAIASMTLYRRLARFGREPNDGDGIQTSRGGHGRGKHRNWTKPEEHKVSKFVREFILGSLTSHDEREARSRELDNQHKTVVETMLAAFPGLEMVKHLPHPLSPKTSYLATGGHYRLVQANFAVPGGRLTVLPALRAESGSVFIRELKFEPDGDTFVAPSDLRPFMARALLSL